MDRSLAALITCHCVTEMQSARTWIVVVAVFTELLASRPKLANEALEKRKNKDAGLITEVLAYHRSRGILLIGLCSPVWDGKAIIVHLSNSDACLNGDAQAELDDSLWSVDQDKGGLRAITYDDRTEQLMLLSRREDHNDDACKLWCLPANGRDSAVRIEIGDQMEIPDRVESLASTDTAQAPGSGVLFVRDNGNEKKEKGADFCSLSHATGLWLRDTINV